MAKVDSFAAVHGAHLSITPSLWQIILLHNLDVQARWFQPVDVYVWQHQITCRSRQTQFIVPLSFTLECQYAREIHRLALITFWKADTGLAYEHKG